MLAMQMQEAAMIMMADSEVNWAAMPLSGMFDIRTGARSCWSVPSRPIRSHRALPNVTQTFVGRLATSPSM